MRHAWLAVVPVLAGCGRSCGQRESSKLLTELSDLAGLAAMELGVEVPSQVETESSVRAIAERVQRRTENGEDPPSSMTRVVFESVGFEREIESEDPRYLLLPTVIHESRGTCVGLTQLMLVVAEQLGLEMHAVLAPGHAFVRYRERNFELLRQGESMPEEWYRERYRVPAGVRAYLRPLSREEAVAVLHFNIANALRRRRDLMGALSHYNQAVMRFNDWPEAHANRGLALQLLGDLAGAGRAYQQARTLFPELPGLADNMAALARERMSEKGGR
jgi:regulator of sirC expression with transglutaminase-like and TPR domain